MGLFHLFQNLNSQCKIELPLCNERARVAIYTQMPWADQTMANLNRKLCGSFAGIIKLDQLRRFILAQTKGNIESQFFFCVMLFVVLPSI